MSEIQIAIAAPDPIPATEELLAIEGLSGSYVVENETEKVELLTAIATIIGIVGGTIAIAEKIYGWYQAYRKGKDKKTVEKVMLISDDGKKLLLEGATVEQIKALLDD